MKQNNYKDIHKHKKTLSRKASILVFILGMSLLSFTSHSNAKQTREVTGNDELLLEISKTDLTRISVENDKIHSLQFKSGILEVTKNNKLGEAYIKPKVDRGINLFITTQKGFVYKLLLKPINIPSEQIILRNKNTFISEGVSQGVSNDTERRLTDIVLSMQKDLPIEGCFIANTKNKKVTSPIAGIKLYTKTKYSCKNYTGYKIEVKNKNAITVTEKDFVTQSTRAVKLYNNYLIIINQAV